MAKISCDVINDLLPLYYDGVCTQESRKLVEEHLEECPSCRAMLKALESDYPGAEEAALENDKEGALIQNISHTWKQTVMKAFIKGVLIAAAVFFVGCLGYYGLFRYPLVIMENDELTVTGYDTEDGSIGVEIRQTGNYYASNAIYKEDGSGNLYILIKRPVFGSKREAGEEPGRYRLGFDINKYQKIYVGESQQDRELVWEKGMELPEAPSDFWKN